MVARLSQAAFVGGELAPSLYARTDLDKYRYALKTAYNVIINRWGGAANRAGTKFIGETRDSSKEARLIPFQFSTTQTYVLEFGDEIMRPIKDGGQVLESAKTITAITQASHGVVTSAGHGFSNGDRLYIEAVGGMTSLNGRFFIAAGVTANTFTLTDMFGTAINTSALPAYTSGGTASRLYQLTTPYQDTEVFDFDYAQTADVAYVTHLGYTVRKLTRSGHASWTLTAVTWGPSLAAPTSPGAVATVGSGSTVYSYVITAYDDDTGEESLPSSVAAVSNDLTVAPNKNTITWTGVSGAERYIVYKSDNGVYGFIGGTTGLSFVDDNIAADLGDTPPAQRDPFASAGNYPATCEFHEGRLVLSYTTNSPSGVWMSQSTRYENLNVSTPAKADDAVSFQLRPGVNAVQGMASLNDLICFTSEAEYKVNGGGVTEAITPASLVVRRQTKRGAMRLKPLVVGDIVLYVQRQGAVIRAFGYSFEKDGYKGNDLTLLAPHLFRGHTIVDWCYQQDPHSIIWCVRDDGMLLSLTFVDDQNVFAWAKHEIAGSFGDGAAVVESIACIEGDGEDEVYLVVKRTINSVTKRYIERLEPRWDGESQDIESAYFVDSGLTYSGAAATTITGLHHLEGETVSALADGNVIEGLTVTNGAITLATAASLVHVGLPYRSDIETLPINESAKEGAVQGRRKRVTGAALKLNQTRGVKYGPNSSLLRELQQRDAEAWSDPMLPYTGDTRILKFDPQWDSDGSFLIRQQFPLPMEVLAVYPDLAVGG